MLLPTVFCERAECLSKDFINLATSGIANYGLQSSDRDYCLSIHPEKG